MKLVIFTLAKNAMPWIAYHYWQFLQLPFDWEWHVCEGTAAPEHCTKWCALMPPGMSEDGTTGYLDSLSFNPRVSVYRSQMWRGKIEMVNAPLKYLFEPCILLEVDADELWTAEQLTKLVELFEKHPKKNAAYFWCRYFVGPDVVITSRDTYGNNSSYEWLRAWRFEPGMRFRTHEPPVLEGLELNPFKHAETEKAGLVFDHMAYATIDQVAWKERYYGSANNENGSKYKDAVKNWQRLQANEQWPVQNLADFLPWVGSGVTAERV